MTPDAGRVKYMRRIEPTTGWGALRKVAILPVVIALSAGFMIGWFEDTKEGFPPLAWPGLFFVCAGLACMCVGLACVVDAVTGLWAMRVLRNGSTVTGAAVMDSHFEAHDSGDGGRFYTYHLVVQFPAGGRGLGLRATVSQKVYNVSRTGRPVMVRYAHANPRIALIEGEDGF
jgi:hypothetical protein